jgi:hypothetical protein
LRIELEDLEKSFYDNLNTTPEVNQPETEVALQVKSFLAEIYEREHRKCKWRQRDKFVRLKEKTRGKPESGVSENIKERWVINRSKRPLNDTEHKLLMRGLKFAITPTKLPIYDIITATEEACYTIKDRKVAESLRGEIVRAVKMAHPPRPNISKQERSALLTLKKDTSIMILPADKGCASVILDKSEYQTKMGELVNNTNTYTPLDQDPTNKFRNKLVKILREWRKELPDRLYLYLYPSGGVPPRMYGLPKIHKAGTPLRPIVSSIGSITYNVARCLANILSPLVGKTKHFVKDSADFVSKIKDLEVPPGWKLTSYDVSALFTSIPTDDALKVIESYLRKDSDLSNRTPLKVEHLLKLAEFCLNTTYFMYEGNYYKQTHGAAMGSPVSPVVANIYMEDFEKRALSSAPHPPALWLRYVDDTFVLIQEDYIPEFTAHINDIDSNIQFTMEPENEGCIPFLDVKVWLLDDGSTKTTVYRKSTHTDQYLSGQSHHPLEHKRSVVRSLTNRAHNIVSTEEDKVAEIQHIHSVLKLNHFEPWMLDIPKKRTHVPPTNLRTEEDGSRTKKMIALPYCKGLSEKCQRIFRNHGINIYHKPGNTIKQELVRPKDKIDKMKRCDCVYHMKCGNCESTYVGETSRTLEVRSHDHIHKRTPLTAVGKHIEDTGHGIPEDNIKILDTESVKHRRRVKEALYIKEHTPDLNRDQGIDLAPIYSHIVSRGRLRRPSHVTQ